MTIKTIHTQVDNHKYDSSCRARTLNLYCMVEPVNTLVTRCLTTHSWRVWRWRRHGRVVNFTARLYPQVRAMPGPVITGNDQR